MATEIHVLKMQLATNGDGTLQCTVKTPKTSTTPKTVHFSKSLLCASTAHMTGEIVVDALKSQFATMSDRTTPTTFTARFCGDIKPEAIKDAFTAAATEHQTTSSWHWPHLQAPSIKAPTDDFTCFLLFAVERVKTSLSWTGTQFNVPLTEGAFDTNTPGPITFPATAANDLKMRLIEAIRKIFQSYPFMTVEESTDGGRTTLQVHFRAADLPEDTPPLFLRFFKVLADLPEIAELFSQLVPPSVLEAVEALPPPSTPEAEGKK